jgi:hypothetical protein
MIRGYLITKEAKKKEVSITEYTMHNNKYNIKPDMKHSNQYKQNNTDPQNQETKWATFTYMEKKSEKSLKKHKNSFSNAKQYKI